uniref:Uncharacterized protein n=1 Tax=Lepeophtheirus salmonis TaxID=72036 RepID=A0A0K2TJU1_LEPSM
MAEQLIKFHSPVTHGSTNNHYHNILRNKRHLKFSRTAISIPKKESTLFPYEAS